MLPGDYELNGDKPVPKGFSRNSLYFYLTTLVITAELELI